MDMMDVETAGPRRSGRTAKITPEYKAYLDGLKARATARLAQAATAQAKAEAQKDVDDLEALLSGLTVGGRRRRATRRHAKKSKKTRKH
jgi:hypothetical protein